MGELYRLIKNGTYKHSTSAYEDNHKEAQRIFSQEVLVVPPFLRLIVAAARPNVLNFTVDPTVGTELQNI